MDKIVLSDLLDLLPVEYIIYILTLSTLSLTVFVLRRSNFSIKSIIKEVIEDKLDGPLTESVDLSFVFDNVNDYIGRRLEEEGRRSLKLSIFILIIKNIFVRKVIERYIRKVVIPELIKKE